MLFGPSNFHSLGPCIYYTDFYYWGFMHSCMFKNTTFHEWFFTRYSFQYTSKPILIGLPCIHVCLKTLLFMNGLFHKIFILFPNTLYWWQRYLFQVSKTHPRQLRAETQINREACPTKALAGKVLHATSQVVNQAKTKLEGNGWVETINDETNTSKPKYGGNDYLFSP